MAQDANGNTITKTDSTGTTTYVWDDDNRLTSVALPGSGGTVSYRYDPFGRRIYKSSSSGTSVYLYDHGINLIEETSATGIVVARYVQTKNIDEPLAMLRSGATRYYEADGLGSITSLSNGTGTVAQNYTYDTFGNLVASSGNLANSLRYTSREFDTETNLYSYRARYYDTSTGRFISEDPVGFRGGSTNFYAYVLNDPVNLLDLSGMCPCPKAGNAPLPQFFEALAAQSPNWVDNLMNLLDFRKGAMMDAQAYGSSPAYANYVFGVYMAAAGYSLPATLNSANAYGFLRAKYPPGVPMDPVYNSIPAANVINSTAGFNAEKTATLCTVSQ
jgi:RHS repeat-associated protein